MHQMNIHYKLLEAMSSQTFLEDFSFFVMAWPAGEWSKLQQVYTDVTLEVTLLPGPCPDFFCTDWELKSDWRAFYSQLWQSLYAFHLVPFHSFC